jgi:hypothetical protein
VAARSERQFAEKGKGIMKPWRYATLPLALFASQGLAEAESVLAGTNWNNDARQLSDGYYSMCHINRIEFGVDGTAEMTFDDHGTMDMDDGTWTLNGANLSIGYVGRLDPKYYARFADETLSGTYTNGKLQLAHSWKDGNGDAQNETCTFTMEAAKRQPTLNRRSRHKSR